MHRPASLTRLSRAPAIVLVLLFAWASPTRASDHCAIAIEPSTVRVGESFTVTAIGFEPNENAQGFAALAPGNSFEISISLDANGSLTRTVVARSFMIGTRDVTLTGDVSQCGASADLTVLAAVQPPNTDAVASVAPTHDGAPDQVLASIWIAAFAAAWTVRRWRARPT